MGIRKELSAGSRPMVCEDGDKSERRCRKSSMTYGTTWLRPWEGEVTLTVNRNYGNPVSSTSVPSSTSVFAPRLESEISTACKAQYMYRTSMFMYCIDLASKTRPVR